MKRTLLALAVVLSGCSSLGGSSPENYQHLLTLLCAAPPSIMGTILTTPELKSAWTFICVHAPSVPASPVIMAAQ